MSKKILVIFLVLVFIPFLAACSSNATQEADVTDETVFTPPEQDGKLTGIWSAEYDTLTENLYFYGDGKSVFMIQNPEEETWCVLAYWSEDGDKVEIKDPKIYKYDTKNGAWNESNETIGLASATQISDDALEGSCTLPDGSTKTANFTREEKNIQVPGDVDINVIINGFLVH